MAAAEADANSLVDPSALDPLIPLEEIRGDISVHPNTLRHWASIGEIPAHKIGNRWFVRRSEWDTFINSTRVSR